MKMDATAGDNCIAKGVLCAHPDEGVASFLRGALAPLEVAVAPSGFEAMKAINTGAFDAYVLDYWLPSWSGVGLCRAIRKLDPHVPICVYSKAASKDYRQRALRAGADLVLTAPQDPDAFRERLAALLQLREEPLERARRATEQAIQAELDRQAELIRRARDRRTASTSAIVQRKVRTTALKAFLDAGGTCAGFERTWQHVRRRVAQATGHEAAQAA